MAEHLNLVRSLAQALVELTPSQLIWVGGVIEQFHLPHEFRRRDDSDFVTPAVLEMLGDALQIHHAFSRQALSKDRFEFALEAALNRSGIQAELVTNRTNRGHDITIAGVPVSLKTQADAGIREDLLHISKFMELGRGGLEIASASRNVLGPYAQLRANFPVPQSSAGAEVSFIRTRGDSEVAPA